MSCDDSNRSRESARCTVCGVRSWAVAASLGIGMSCLAAVGLGYWLGTRQRPAHSGLPLPLAAATSDSTDNMAMATGPISEDTEGVFFLDFNTGDLQCLVYNPRFGGFRAHYFTNVRSQLGGAGKNSKYLLATGAIVSGPTAGGARPAGTLVYVTDVNTGLFAAYAVPWDRTMEASGRLQSGPLVFAGGGPIRNYELQNPGNAPPAVQDPKAKAP